VEAFSRYHIFFSFSSTFYLFGGDLEGRRHYALVHLTFNIQHSTCMHWEGIKAGIGLGRLGWDRPGHLAWTLVYIFFPSSSSLDFEEKLHLSSSVISTSRVEGGPSSADVDQIFLFLGVSFVSVCLSMREGGCRYFG
jgi:hypothetical protein